MSLNIIIKVDGQNINNLKTDNSEKPQATLKRQTFESSLRIPLKGRPFIESHRGCNRLAPENSLSAFKKAIEIGCDSIEFDVWLSKDKIPVVIHGNSKGEIEETTTGKGCVNDFTFRQLSEFFIHNHDEGIPSLEYVLILCKDKIFVNIEIKDTNLSECFTVILNLINQHEMNRQVAISSFQHDYWEEIKKKEKHTQIEFGFLYDTAEGQICEFILTEERRNSTINLWYKEVNPDIVQKAHEKNIAVHCWFGMADPETEEIFKYLMECGTDIICTNTPQLAMKVRDDVFGAIS